MAAPRKAAASARKPEGARRVQAPLVQVRLGNQVLHLFDGDVVPDGVSQDQLDHLADLGYIEAAASDEK